MKYIGNKEKLRRANQKVVYLKKELKHKDKIIDLILEDMLKGECYFSSKTLLKNYYESKVEE